MISWFVSKVTPGEVWILIKYRSIFTLRENLEGRISFVVQDSQYAYTASPWTPRICNLRNFCNIEVEIAIAVCYDKDSFPGSVILINKTIEPGSS
jgi:hypothetical protein